MRGDFHLNQIDGNRYGLLKKAAVTAIRSIGLVQISLTFLFSVWQVSYSCFKAE